MPFEFHRCGRVIMIHWSLAPRSGDMADIVQRTAAARRTELRLGVVEIVAESSGVPAPDVLCEAIIQARPMRHLRETHAIVIEGDSRRRAIVRGVGSVFAFALGEELGFFTRTNEAIAHVCRVVEGDERTVIAEARARGWIVEPSGSPRSSRPSLDSRKA